MPTQARRLAKADRTRRIVAAAKKDPVVYAFLLAFHRAHVIKTERAPRPRV